MLKSDVKKQIHQALKNATVKIFVGGEFQGTGFFITPDGYILTAFHCIGEYPPQIEVETRFDGKFVARLDEEKSLRNFDIAVLKINYRASHCLPLGFISEGDIGDDVVSIGYPAGHKPNSRDIGIYFGRISRFLADNKFENDAVKGQGQSGGLVYHYATHRVVGLAVQGYKSDVILHMGLAARFNPLFEKWIEFKSINDKVIQTWEKKLIKKEFINPKKSIIYNLKIVSLIFISFFISFAVGYYFIFVKPEQREIPASIKSSDKDKKIVKLKQPKISTSVESSSKDKETVKPEQPEISIPIEFSSRDKEFVKSEQPEISALNDTDAKIQGHLIWNGNLIKFSKSKKYLEKKCQEQIKC